MIVYVESNFVLEAALEQREATAVKDILTLAENQELKLAFPSFSLSEPFTTIMQIQSERQRFRDSSNAILKRLEQSELSELHSQVVSALHPLLNLLTRIVDRELALLHSTVQQMLIIGTSIETDASSFKQALIYQGSFGLQPKDSIIYAAVIADLQKRTQEEPKCFLSRNWKDFDVPGIKSELALYNCRYIASFKEGLRFIQRFP